MKIAERIDRIIGFSTEDTNLARFGRERIRSVRDIIFGYYLAILLPFASIAVSFPDRQPTQIVGGILALVVLLRFRHWGRPAAEGQGEDASRARWLSCFRAFRRIFTSVWFYQWKPTGQTPSCG